MRPILFILLLLSLTSCSSNIGRFADTRQQDSIAKAEALKLARKTPGYEEPFDQREFDSLVHEAYLKSGLDSFEFYQIPQGFTRVVYSTGETYLEPMTADQIRESSMKTEAEDGGSGPIVAFDLDGNRVGTAGFRERGKPYKIDTTGLPPGTYMLSIPGEKQMKKIVVQ